MRKLKAWIAFAVIVAVIFVGAIALRPYAEAACENARIDTLKTDYATWPTNPDGSLVEYPTGGSWEQE